jgi:hypothetical protein
MVGKDQDNDDEERACGSSKVLDKHDKTINDEEAVDKTRFPIVWIDPVRAVSRGCTCAALNPLARVSIKCPHQRQLHDVSAEPRHWV